MQGPFRIHLFVLALRQKWLTLACLRVRSSLVTLHSLQFLLEACFDSTCTHPALVLPSYWHKAIACHHSDHFSRKAAFLPHYFRAIACSIVVGPSLVVCLLPGHMTVKKATLCMDPVLLQVPIYLLLCLDLDISNWT